MSKRTEVQRLVEQLERGGVSRREFVSRAMALGLSLSSVGLLLSACKGKEGGAGGTTAADSAMADLGPLEKELHLFNWSATISSLLSYVSYVTLTPNSFSKFGTVSSAM